VEIKPIWAGNQYRFTYNVNLPEGLTEEEIATISQPSATNATYTNTFTTPVLPDLTNWTFAGWNTTSTASTALPNEIKMQSFILAYDLVMRPSIDMGMQTNATIPLYAVWIPKGMVNIYVNNNWKKA
jgi:hypothetical protein